MHGAHAKAVQEHPKHSGHTIPDDFKQTNPDASKICQRHGVAHHSIEMHAVLANDAETTLDISTRWKNIMEVS